MRWIMLIKMVKKRTFLILSSLIILLIVYLFPTKKEDKTYIQNENTDFSIVYLIDQNNLLSRVSVVTKNTNIDNQIKLSCSKVFFLTIYKIC